MTLFRGNGGYKNQAQVQGIHSMFRQSMGLIGRPTHSMNQHNYPTKWALFILEPICGASNGLELHWNH